MTKKEIRNSFKNKRKEIPATERLKMDDLLLIQLQRLSFGDSVKVVMSYWPMEDHAEPNTHLFTYYLENHIPEIIVAYPVINRATSEMKAIVVQEETDFVENSFGIAEPENGEEIAPGEIDLVLVPLLAVDSRGYRVGFGKGYYDRFLSQCRADVIKVGFSYFEPIDRIDDANQFDVPLNFCITPHRLYEF